IPGIKGFGQLLEGWKLNTIVNLQTAQPWLVADTSGNNFSGTLERVDRWNFFGNPQDFSGYGGSGIPYCDFSKVADITTGTAGVRCYQQSSFPASTRTCPRHWLSSAWQSLPTSALWRTVGATCPRTGDR